MKNVGQTKQTNSQIQTDVKVTNPRKRLWWTWLVIFLFPVALYLPLWGENLQINLIGYEGFCCMPENWEELKQKAERAREMRLESNLIIGAGVLLAIVLTIGIAYVLYKYAIPCFKSKIVQCITQIVVGVIMTPLATLLLCAAMMLIFHNDDYHRVRYQTPRDTIYAYAIDFSVPHVFWYQSF